LSLARSSLLYPSLLASSSIDKKTAMAGEFELCLVFFLLLFFSPPSSAALVLYWLLIRLLCGDNLSRYASCLHESVYTLYVFFSCGLFYPVSVCGFGLAWFGFFLCGWERILFWSLSV
jgi:hypothetical protein